MAEAKRRRLSGEVYWKMQDVLEKGDEQVKAYKKWVREQCRKLKLIPELVGLIEGVVYDNPPPKRPGDPPRHPVARIEDDAIVAEANRMNDEIDALNAEIQKLIKQVAMKLGVRADQINPKTGMIAPEADDVELVDVDALPTAE